MHSLSEHELLLSLLAISLILVVGRGTAEIARKFNQPEVLGELIGGFILGPSIFGALLPNVYQALFLQAGVGTALSAFSWVGAILLLLLAGMEAELALLREHSKAGSLAAILMVAGSLAIGTWFSTAFLGTKIADGMFLGVVLSVTAVSVAAKILMEKDVLRRGYAQVILAAGIASEVVVWLFISALSALHTGDGNPWLAGLKSALFAALFFIFMLTIFRRFTFWAMRRISDTTHLLHGQLSLVIVFAFLCAAATQSLGLHALLGAFAFGVVLGESPRATVQLRTNIQTLALTVFAPIFFVLAGMRVDIFKLGSLSAVGTVLLLFLLASAVKVSLSALGAKLGKLPNWEAIMVGVGLNLKGGTDVIVAILGTELGLLSARSYSMYAIVAILTVLVTPRIMAWLEQKVPPSEEETTRLNREEAKRHAYLSDVERVLAPVMPELMPGVTAHVLETVARTKQEQSEIFDITQMTFQQEKDESSSSTEVETAKEKLDQANELKTVELTDQHVTEENPVDVILKATGDFNLVAIGAAKPRNGALLSFGTTQDLIIDRSKSDVLVVVDHAPGADVTEKIDNILVPIIGMEYSMAAADIAAHIAKPNGARVTLFNVMADDGRWRWADTGRRALLDTGYRVLAEVSFRLEPLEVLSRQRVRISNDPGAAILNELERGNYQMIVMGVVEREGRNGLYLGRTPQKVIAASKLPVVLLVSHNRSAFKLSA